jgi:hypothetical protein
MENTSTDLKSIFIFVRDNPNSNARQVGKILEGGKSRANHYLYGYLEILFTKRGLAPPTWKVTANDAYEKMIQRLNPQSVQAEKTPIRKQKVRAIGLSRQYVQKRELPPISICYSCDLPIKPNGFCGCS